MFMQLLKPVIAALVIEFSVPPALALQANQVPTSIPIPWANSAGASYITATPTLSQIGVTPGRASFTDGFPPLNFQPIGSGGIPPFGADFNGILNQTTAGLRWFQVGGPINWSSAYSTTIGGYPKGAIVQSATTVGLLWLSTADNNASNPDTGGANWSAVLQPHGRQTFTANGTFTVPPGVALVKARCWAAGGGGGFGQTAGDVGAAGGGGEYREGLFSVTPAAAITVTIGAGGAAGIVGAISGGTGGNTVFTGLTTCNGGGAGVGSNGGGISLGFGVGGSAGSGGDSFPGGNGTLGFIASNFLYLALGGPSFGSGNGPPAIGSNALPGAANASNFPGQGGGGSGNGGPAQPGRAGELIIEW